MPSDITGTEVIQEDKQSGAREFRFLKGPIFGNVILADEINRTPPKTQAALLEAMQEHQITAGGARHQLDEPFFVLATQNPIEHEGTYPLPEAQLDRFMFNTLVDYPDEEEEMDIVQADHGRHRRPRHADARRRAEFSPCRRSSAACRWPITWFATPCNLVRLTRPRQAATVPAVRLRLCAMGRRSAGEPIPDSGRQGPRHFARSLPCRLRRRARGGASRAAAPHSHQLQRRGRRNQAPTRSSVAWSTRLRWKNRRPTPAGHCLEYSRRKSENSIVI